MQHAQIGTSKLCPNLDPLEYEVLLFVNHTYIIEHFHQLLLRLLKRVEEHIVLVLLQHANVDRVQPKIDIFFFH